MRTPDPNSLRGLINDALDDAESMAERIESGEEVSTKNFNLWLNSWIIKRLRRAKEKVESRDAKKNRKSKADAPATEPE